MTVDDAPRDERTDDEDVVRICFVCLGNICRSPTAEGVMLHLVAERGLSDRIIVDSAGTGAWHVGEPADARSFAEAQRRGVHLPSRARQFREGDFYEFDYVIAMDARNLADLHDLAPERHHRERTVLLRTFDPASATSRTVHLDVPDPYYGGDNGFADVYDLIEAACRGLLDHIEREHQLA